MSDDTIHEGQTTGRIDPEHLERVRARFEQHHKQIETLARAAHRKLHGEMLDDSVSETVGWVWKSFLSLAQRGDDPIPLLPSIVRYAAGHVRAGKLVGRNEARDALSRFAKEEGGYSVSSIPVSDEEDASPELTQGLCRHSRDPALEAICNVDYSHWLATLSAPQREVAQALASGLNSTEVAEVRGVSKASVQQVRDRLERKWEEFHGQRGR